MTSIKDDGSVEFKFYRPTARDVKVAGDFCGWQGSPLQMRPETDGWWTVVTKLACGEYQFRYIADGTWFTDFASNGIEVTRQGWNSVLVVPEKAGGRRATATATENKTKDAETSDQQLAKSAA